jgi:chitinase
VSIFRSRTLAQSPEADTSFLSHSSCSDTPFLYNGQQVITYDDPSSISDKGQFARETGLAGVGIWSIDADTSDLAIASAAINGMAL